MDLTRLRRLIQSHIENNSLPSAVFLSGKLVTLSGGEPDDVLLHGRALFALGEYAAAQHAIQRMLDEATTNESMQQHEPFVLRGVLLATQCLLKRNKPDAAQVMLDTVLLTSPLLHDNHNHHHHHTDSVSILALLCLERAKAFSLQDNKERAQEWMKKTLTLDPSCVEALDVMIGGQLRPNDEQAFYEHLVTQGSFHGSREWLQPVYMALMGKHRATTITVSTHALTPSPSPPTSSSRFSALESLSAAPPTTEKGTSLIHDPDMMACQAESRFLQRDARGALEITKRIYAIDPYHTRAMLVHVAALVELGLTTELFYFAHTMVKELPTRALSWYCAGAYYFSAHKYDAARRFMQKATVMDQHLLPAWIGFAHSYAVHDESDRSMAAYRNAARLFPGSHEPVLGTAMEYLRTNNVALAELFCRQALSLCDSDPAVYNELGVVYFRQRNFVAAVDCFQHALARCTGLPDRMIHWDIGLNLAHALRRAGKLEAAVIAYGNALARVPKSASGHGALGLTFHLLGDFSRAVERYHFALAIKPDDALMNELLSMALVDLYGGGG